MGSPRPSGGALLGSPLGLTLMAVTPNPTFVLRGGRILDANRAAQEATGHARRRLLEMRFDELLHPDCRERAVELTGGAGSPGEPRRLELELEASDGRTVWLELTLVEIEAGGEPALLAHGVDVTELRRTRRRLEGSRESLRLVQRAARSLYWEWDPETDRLSVGPFIDELFGFAAHQVVRSGSEFIDLVHPEDRERLRRALRNTLQQGDDLALELRFITPSGEVRWLAERGVAVRDDDGWTRRVIGVAQDISERRIAEEALFQEKERADVTLASIADGVIRTDLRGMIDYLNPVAQRLTGWSLAEAYGRPADEIYRVVDPATGNPLLDPLNQTLRDRREAIQLGDRLLVDRDGARHPIQDSAAPIRNRAGDVIGAVLVFRDLSRLHQIQLEMDRLANHDALTGLINRKAFIALIEQTLAGSSGGSGNNALCHFDLDNFRLVNESSGQAAGDQLIQQTATLIRAHLEEGDVVAHLGGDAFAVLMLDCTLAQAVDRAEEIRHAIRGARFSWQERVFSTPVSAGLVPIPAPAPAAEALLRDADSACSVAKEKGGDRIHTYQPGDSSVAERYGQMQWIARVSKAFEEDRFVLYRQTIVPLQGDGAGQPFYELLVRMIGEEGELVAPGNFIPAAERFGMIAEIDRWVLCTAMRELAERSGKDGAQPRFTINISGSSLGVTGFLDLVVEQFERTGAPPSQILFEITETAAIADLPRAQRFLAALKGMGCQFILDDFGKGLSSLGYLRNLPLDFLKIDGSFVRDMVHDPIQMALVASIHEIGEVTGLRTIAESVEDEETLDAVRRIGIDYAQGFLLGRPEPLGGAAGGG